MAIDWLQALLLTDDCAMDEDYSMETELAWEDLAKREIRDRQVWRICTLLRAALNERKGKPGDLGRNQGQIRAISEGLHELTFRRLKGNFSGLDGLILAAEGSKAARDRWFKEALSPALKKQVEFLTLAA